MGRYAKERGKAPILANFGLVCNEKRPPGTVRHLGADFSLKVRLRPGMELPGLFYLRVYLIKSCRLRVL